MKIVILEQVNFRNYYKNIYEELDEIKGHLEDAEANEKRLTEKLG